MLIAIEVHLSKDIAYFMKSLTAFVQLILNLQCHSVIAIKERDLSLS